MIISTTDPVTLHEISNPEKHPFVIEGRGENTLKIYFESEETRRTYLEPALSPIPESGDSPLSNITPFNRENH